MQSARLARSILVPLTFAAALACACLGGAAAVHADRADSAAVAAPSAAPTHAPSDSAAVARADTLPFTLREARRLVGGAGDARGLAEPAGVAVDAFGRTYVADRSLHRLVRFDASGAWLGERGALGSEPASLRRPSGVVLAGSFTVAVLDEDNRRIVGYDLYGEKVRTLVDLDDPVVRDVTGPVRPVSLGGDRGGALYVADGDHDRILVFDTEGRLQRTVGTFGDRPGAFRGLAAVAVGRRGDLVTAEREGGRVQRLESGGRAMLAWRGAWAVTRGRLAIAVDDSGRVAIADEGARSVWVYAPEGRLLAARFDLDGPAAVCFGRPGELWVAEARGGRVRRLDLVATPRPGASRP